ncbi:MAG: AraC family transcriptional regulator [Halioglobus sp.]|nr:AraC family transcriptional regulator [Halioglobus sp.]|tara:strand:- start:1245 stop:2225 length:981 start_codon:yes stop_codon:yes gene_type:complete
MVDAATGMDDTAVVQSIAPLVQLLQQELTRADIAQPSGPPRSARGFVRWYIEVAQSLEAHVAGRAGHAPMSRGEVELMCRCALTGRTLGEAIALCGQYCASLYPRGGHVTLRGTASRAEFVLDSLRTEQSAASSLADIMGLFGFYQLFQWLVGVELPLERVCIGPVGREDVLPFLKLFRTPVLVGGDEYALQFAGGAPDLPVVRSSADFPAFFEIFPCGVFHTGREGLRQQVAAVLAAAAEQGTGLPTQAELAATFGLSLSSFRRRLAEGGSSFRALREEALLEAALVMLGRGDRSIAGIAAHLGFSDGASFRRAFRQWTGHAPTR